MRHIFITFLVFFVSVASFAHDILSLFPTTVATHEAQQSGNWFDESTWNNGEVPGEGAIVFIPEGRMVTYEGEAEEHIFAIRVDGTLTFIQTNQNAKTKVVFDTYIGTANSITKFLADSSSDGEIEEIIKAFDIESFKATSTLWNAEADALYTNIAKTYQVSRTPLGSDRYNSYAQAISGNTSINVGTPVEIDVAMGVLGRHTWDSEQISLGLVTMGEIEIQGRQKLNMVKLAANATKGSSTLSLESSPGGWQVGDSIVVTMDGNHNTNSRGDDLAQIAAISGNSITLESPLQYNHLGRSADGLHCYVGNLTRNITFKSESKVIRQRGHLMVMHNDTNIKIKNAAFIDMGRTDKSVLLDDHIWKRWVDTKIFNSKWSALGQEVAEIELNPANQILNHRGRYSIHLHRIGASFGTNLAEVTGNVVWRNPGWGITHHHSYADVSQNVVYDVTGSGIVSESGSEIGFWDNNLVANIKKGHDGDVYVSALMYDDYLFSGQALGMKGRAVMCKGNVVANAFAGVGVMNMNPIVNTTDRLDPEALANLRPGFEIDQFPMDVNGYSSEGDGVMPVEAALIMENTTMIWCNQGLRSIERDMGVNHESRSIFNGFKVWGANQGLSITYQADYSFRDVFISGKNPDKSIGAYLWKHSHNHLFDGIKMVDLKYGITVSKLVTSGNGTLKTRNNGFTPWILIDLITENVDTFYELENDDPNDTAPYPEHGDNVIIASSQDFVTRPITFTILDSSEMTVDYAAEKFRFEVDGIVTDRLGSYHFGIKQAPAQGTLRLGYPSRIYEFANKSKFEEYLSSEGLYKTEDDQYYFIIYEYVPDRYTYQFQKIPIRILIENPGVGGIWNSISEEALGSDDPSYHLLSRYAEVSQSSTQSGVFYDGNLIDVGPHKAVDGNNNGRITCNLYQQGLVPIGSFSQTMSGTEEWYELDLKEEKVIDFIDVWNTVDINGSAQEPVSAHFNDFWVLVSKDAFTSNDLATAKAEADYKIFYDEGPQIKYSLSNLNIEGRYIRIQKEGSGILKFAEIEVIGKKFEGCIKVRNNQDQGLGSLRNAIDCAVSGDSIVFSSELKGDTIQVLSSPLIIDKHLTVNPPSAYSITLGTSLPNTIEIQAGNNVLFGNLNLLYSSGSQPIIRNYGTLSLRNVELNELE